MRFLVLLPYTCDNYSYDSMLDEIAEQVEIANKRESLNDSKQANFVLGVGNTIKSCRFGYIGNSKGSVYESVDVYKEFDSDNKESLCIDVPKNVFKDADLLFDLLNCLSSPYPYSLTEEDSVDMSFDYVILFRNGNSASYKFYAEEIRRMVHVASATYASIVYSDRNIDFQGVRQKVNTVEPGLQAFSARPDVGEIVCLRTNILTLPQLKWMTEEDSALHHNILNSLIMTLISDLSMTPVRIHEALYTTYGMESDVILSKSHCSYIYDNESIMDLTNTAMNWLKNKNIKLPSEVEETDEIKPAVTDVSVLYMLPMVPEHTINICDSIKNFRVPDVLGEGFRVTFKALQVTEIKELSDIEEEWNRSLSDRRVSSKSLYDEYPNLNAKTKNLYCDKGILIFVRHKIMIPTPSQIAEIVDIFNETDADVVHLCLDPETDSYSQIRHLSYEQISALMLTGIQTDYAIAMTKEFFDTIHPNLVVNGFSFFSHTMLAASMNSIKDSSTYKVELGPKLEVLEDEYDEYDDPDRGYVKMLFGEYTTFQSLLQLNSKYALMSLMNKRNSK